MDGEQNAPTREQLQAAFTRDLGGPNPYYRCNTCGALEPGLTEYLAAHWLMHNIATQAAPAAASTKESA